MQDFWLWYKLTNKILKSHQEDRGKNGVYDQRNKLNNLTGKQWLFSTRSVITKTHPRFYNNNSMLSEKYYDYLPVHLIKDIILTFSKPNALIVDPFCNVGSSGFATLLASDHRSYIGWNKKTHKGLIRNVELKSLHEDKVMNFLKTPFSTDNSFVNMEKTDFIFTELIFSTNETTLCQTEFNQWLKLLISAFKIFYQKLFKPIYIAIAIQNTKDVLQYHYNSQVIVNKLTEIGWILKAELVWQIQRMGQVNNKLKINLHLNGINDKRILIFRTEKG